MQRIITITTQKGTSIVFAEVYIVSLVGYLLYLDAVNIFILNKLLYIIHLKNETKKKKGDIVFMTALYIFSSFWPCCCYCLPF